MTGLRRLLALGAVAFLLLLALTFPARIVTSQLERYGIVASGVSGSVWQGHAASLRAGGIPFGELDWDLHVLKLLTGRASASIALKQNTAFAQGEVSVAAGGRVTLSGFTASWPVAELSGAGLPGGWSGTANVQLDELALDDGVPAAITGTIDLLELVGPANRPARMGSYRATFPAPDSSPEAGRIVGALQDLDGPIEVAARVLLGPGRSYEVDGQIATRPGAPADVVNALQYLGEPDAAGRRPFSLAGTY